MLERFLGPTNWHRTGNQLANYSALMQQSHITSGGLQQANFPFTASSMLEPVPTPAVTTSSFTSCSGSAQAYTAPSSGGSGDYQHGDSGAVTSIWGTRFNNETNWSHHNFSSITENYG